MDDNTVADQVHFTVGELKTIMGSLKKEADKVRHDISTKYDEDTVEGGAYTVEDDMFLGDRLARVSALIFKMQDEYGLTEF